MPPPWEGERICAPSIWALLLRSLANSCYPLGSFVECLPSSSAGEQHAQEEEEGGYSALAQGREGGGERMWIVGEEEEEEEGFHQAEGGKRGEDSDR